jgi:hypothetical protein
MCRICRTQGEMRNDYGPIFLIGESQGNRLSGKHIDIDKREIFKLILEEEGMIHWLDSGNSH